MLHCAKLLIQGFALVTITPEAACSWIPWPSFQSLGTGFRGQVPGTTGAMTLGRMGVMGGQVYPHLGYSLRIPNLLAELASFMAFGNSFSFPVLLCWACSPSGRWTTMNLQWCHWYEMFNPHRKPFPFQAQTWLHPCTRKVAEFGMRCQCFFKWWIFFPLIASTTPVA